VHISALADRFVQDPHSVVKAGDIVKVKVMEVDIPRARIALSMRLSDEPGEARSNQPQRQSREPSRNRNESPRQRPSADNNSAGGTMAALFANAGKIKKK
ncbi:MAG: S1 RNA-binding domain-containing protein, partial [Thiopseudomonas sp.]